jgi:hypothetical protein
MGVIRDINGLNRRENEDNKIIGGGIGDCIELAELIIFIKKKNWFFQYFYFLFLSQFFPLGYNSNNWCYNGMKIRV